MIFKNSKVYDYIKYALFIVVPALILLIGRLGGIWHFDTQQVTDSIAAIAEFLGAILLIGNIRYKKNEEMMAGEDCNENQMLMMENMLEEDEQRMIKGE